MNEDAPTVLGGMQVIVGVTGGIAAYKVPGIVRGLVKQGANVRVAMTRNALNFVTPLTLQTLSGSPVLSEMFETGAGPPMAHIEWTREIDLMLIVPATANFIGKMANGIADDLLSTIVLTLEAPILIAPSMNPRMYNNPAVVRNLDVLRERGVPILEPGMGELACGDEGVGRMAEVEEILRSVQELLKPKGPLSGKRVLVTAGPTLEPVDPVRYISNRSSGEMGYALALEAYRMGAEVTLVSGPTALAPPRGVKCLPVNTALEMQKTVESEFPDTDVLIMAAAVGDYRVEASYSEKIKKGSKSLSLPLMLNPDILKGLAAARRKGQVLVGFAAETENLKEEAVRKLHEKGLDFIVANDVSENGTGFGSDKNKVMILDRKGVVEETGVLPKREIARKILTRIGATQVEKMKTEG